MNIVKYLTIQIKSSGKYISKHNILGYDISDELDYSYFIPGYHNDPRIKGIHESDMDYSPEELEIKEVPFGDYIPKDTYLNSIGMYLYSRCNKYEKYFPYYKLGYTINLKAVDLQISSITYEISITIHTQEERHKDICLKIAKDIYKLLKQNNLLSEKYRIRYALTGTRDSYPLDIYSISKNGRFRRLSDNDEWYQYARIY